jgi:hypothetical protein
MVGRTDSLRRYHGHGYFVILIPSGDPQARLVYRRGSRAKGGAGNVTGITDLLAGTRSQTFQYDALYRLTYASGLYALLRLVKSAAGAD